MNYDEIYYVMCPGCEDKDEIFHVTPTDATALRRFHYRELVYGEPALKFEAENENVLNSSPLMLFCKPTFIISSKIKEVFDDGVYGGKLYPANIFFNNARVNDYFALNMFDDLDCWDRDKSDFKQNEPDYYPRVYQYRLNSSTLDKIIESERLIFKMGGADLSPLIVHKKVKDKIENKVDNIKFFSVSKYRFGDEY